jgi:DinB superfamily
MSLSTSIITRLQHQHETLQELIENFTEEQLKLRVIPDKWSVFEQIVHLTTYQSFHLLRIQKIEQENNPVFNRYIADADPLFLEGCKKSLKDLLAQLYEQRQTLIQHLTTLPGGTLNRCGRHPKFGLLSLTDWTDFFLLHEAHHLFSIFKLIKEWKASHAAIIN